ncbi:hypothetical protein ABKV19_017033 [Rosa sericea]
MLCMKTCSYTAYAHSNIREGGSGCLLWFSDMIGIRNFRENGQDICIRLAASEQDNEEIITRINAKPAKSNVKKVGIIVSTLVLSTALLILGVALLFYVWKKDAGKLSRSHKENLELPLFDLTTIVNATCNFSNDNKLGEGGFGSVFKVYVERWTRNRREKACKRLYARN